jgi:uncharacterized protein (TIGR03067 family)
MFSSLWISLSKNGPTMEVFKAILWAVTATVAGIGWTAAASDAKEALIKEELKKLAGTWRLVSSEKDGRNAPEDEVKQANLIIVGDKYTLQRASKTIEEGTVRIDPTKKPKTIDIYPTKPEGKLQMGIYECVGNEELKVCYTHPGTAQTRPSLFSTTKGTGHVMSVCKREK